MNTDHDKIVAVTVRYCWALDHMQWQELDQVFVPDAIADYGSDARYVGPQQVAEFCAGVAKASGIDRSQHVVLNHDIEIDGDVAVCRTQNQSHYVLRPAPGSSEPRVLDIGGNYLDRFVRTPDGWRISHRVSRKTWRAGDTGAHGAPAPAAPNAETAFVVAGWFDVEPARRDEIVAAGLELARATSDEPGSLELALTPDPMDDGRIRVYSRWASEATFRGHMDTAHQKAFREVLRSAGLGASQIRRYVVSEETPVLAWTFPLDAEIGAGR